MTIAILIAGVLGLTGLVYAAFVHAELNAALQQLDALRRGRRADLEWQAGVDRRVAKLELRPPAPLPSPRTPLGGRPSLVKPTGGGE